MEKKNIVLKEKEVAFVIGRVSVIMNYETALDFMEDTGLIDKFIDIDEEDEDDKEEDEDELCNGDCANCTDGPCANDTDETYDTEDEELEDEDDKDTGVDCIGHLLDLIFGSDDTSLEKKTDEENYAKPEEDKLIGYIKLMQAVLEKRENSKKEINK